ncbi:MAG: sensor histidine kinase [Pseudobdellovibrio sp.]
MSFLSVPYVRYAIVTFFVGLILLTAICIAIKVPQTAIEFKEGDIIQVPNSYNTISLTTLDLISDPSEILTFSEMNDFYTRQDLITKYLNTPGVAVVRDNQTIYLSLKEKSLKDFSDLFWIQLIVCIGGIMISGWIWSLNPHALSSRLFFLSGISMGVSAAASAVYSTRNLSLTSEVFKPLSMLNSAGAVLFGVAMIGLFTVYPVVVKHWKAFLVSQALFFITWGILYVEQAVPDFAHINLLIVTMMFFILVMIVYQFFLTQNDPISRAILKWLGVSVLVGAGAYALLNALPLVLNSKPLKQGYAFITFLIIYLGIAFGLRKFRLFDVGRWAYLFLFYAIGAVVFILLDFAMIYLFDIDRFPALTAALIITTFIYLPLRDNLWRILSRQKKTELHELIAGILHVVYADNSYDKMARWKKFLKDIYNPLEINEVRDFFKNQPVISNDGIRLIFPPIVGLPSVQLSYPQSGRSLFNQQSLDTAQRLSSFLKEIELGHKSYERGVSEERQRIARDLHDDVGARLLSGLHGEHLDLRSVIKTSLDDMRSIIKGISGEEIELCHLLADIRGETSQRLSVVNIELNWISNLPQEFESIKVNYRLYKALYSFFRELVSNVIKHSKSNSVDIKIEISQESYMRIHFFDNGLGYSAEALTLAKGLGLKNLKKRAEDLGGKIEYKNADISRGAQAQLMIPI